MKRITLYANTEQGCNIYMAHVIMTMRKCQHWTLVKTVDPEPQI